MIVIDPYMLVLPSGDQLNALAVQEYVQRLIRWEREFSHQKRYIISEGALEVIRSLGLEPTRANLKTLFDQFGIVEYSPQDVAPTVRGVLVNSPRVEQEAGLYDSELLLMTQYVKEMEVVIPEEIRARLHPDIASAFIQSLAYAGYAREMRRESNGWSIATAPLKEDEPTAEMLLRCAIEKLDDDDIVREDISQTWPLLFDPEHVYATDNVVEFYQSDPYMATRIAWCRMKARGIKLHGLDLHLFTFGAKFLESLDQPRIRRRPNFERDIERVFEAIVYVLEDLWLYPSDKHHPLREIINLRSSRQQTRLRVNESGKSCIEKAVRVEAVAGVNCLHVHYWQCFDGTYEFSNVTDDHNDPTIFA